MKENGVRGILKKNCNTKREGHIVWDEENLAETEAQKSSTMKIDEPKTPYHYYMQSDEDMEDEVESCVNGARDKLSGLRSGSTSEEGCSSGLSEDEEKSQRKKAFKEKRRQHYNEGQMLKMFRQQHPAADEDERTA
mmetsp:Transcript_39559/g.99727  ORF Transcript_39559/g.99727 Transcript_39559/m.99727 type:complete len:136 (-) Transcript_39559:113-520(-)|eukprot:CAMPEP_0177644872 /NCGR_PEP_ID=MMETSP0447-20121125/8931_1 /TAXON_ID=0 /ORGANISM="Stygamoeba regulata, Strain BSH-02190019" /LENGTH=135 /DNA_ID=CAMNT_0019147285 /DNA_START=13 /DNA_END=420 /DNA_ORIENTATION=-